MDTEDDTGLVFFEFKRGFWVLGLVLETGLRFSCSADGVAFADFGGDDGEGCP